MLILYTLCYSFLQISGTEAGVMYVSLKNSLLLTVLKCVHILRFYRSKWQDGYFKIRRGTNECGIEEDVVAGVPSKRNIIREVAAAGSFMDASY